MKRVLSLAAAAVALAGPCLGQPAPFDMSPEQPEPPAEAAPAAPAPEAKTPAPADPRLSLMATPPNRAADAEAAVRHVVPGPSDVLAGETASRSWPLDLTAAEAGAATLQLAYQSALMAAPEASRLRLRVNDVVVIDAPVRSPDGVIELVATVPPDVLRPGRNLVTLEAEQRHRTDCTLESTYELWAEIDGARTFLRLDAPEGPRFRSLEDIRAIGADATGETRVAIVAPDHADPATGTELLRLAQGIARLADMPNLSFSVASSIDDAFADAELKVLFGTADALDGALDGADMAAGSGPVARFVGMRDAGEVLVVAGPDPRSLAKAAAELIGLGDAAVPAGETGGPVREAEIPLLASGGRASFAELGVPTREFSGRRYTTDFQIAMPADFYAESYGEARVLLDVGYSEDVLPGSSINIYVNDNIASVLPINSRGGGLLRDLPINVTMRHFRPGVNTLRLEALMPTESDAACAAGASTSTLPRFALFDTSEFVMPRFARIARRPNLAATSGSGYPYASAEAPVPVVMDAASPEALSAAATLLGKMASTSLQAIPVEITASAAAAADRDAIFVAPAAQLLPEVLSRVGIAETARTAWSAGEPAPGEAAADTEEAIEEWRRSLDRSSWRQPIAALDTMLERHFEISLDALRLRPPRDEAYAPPDSATLLLAQGANTSGTGTWTLLTAPTPALLSSGARVIAREANWTEIGGRISVLQEGTGEVLALAASQTDFVPSQPWSLTNSRLILANWMSANILFYSVLLGLGCILLGLATALLLSLLGRPR